jgi:RHS repeat-associated protein
LNQTGDWYATTAPENKYQYNGKELNEELGLNWYNYGARMYDATIGRFPCIDPIADQFPHVSAYNCAENEPIAHIDLHGLQKYKPKVQPIQKPSDLLSTKMLNNVWEGVKTVTREFFSKDVGNILKNTGSTIEYSGILSGMGGQIEFAVP